MRLVRLVTSLKFWGGILVLPFVLVACASLTLSLMPRFDSDDLAMRRSVAADADGLIQLSYLESGDPTGHRVIFVHGTPGEAANWYDLFQSRPSGFHMIAVDRPGFGSTRPRDAVPSLEAQARALAPLIDRPGNGKPILVGHSLGGPIVVKAALLFGDRIGGIVIAAGSLDPDLEDVPFIQHIGNTPPFSWLLTTEYRNANRELIALEADLRAMAPTLAELTIPVVIVHGTEDSLVPYDNVKFMETHLTGTDPALIRLDGIDHFLPWTSHREIMQAVETIAASISHPLDQLAAEAR